MLWVLIRSTSAPWIEKRALTRAMPLYIHERYVAELGFELVTPGSESDALATVQEPGFFQSKSIYVFLISPQKHMLWYSLEVHNICFCGEIRKIST